MVRLRYRYGTGMVGLRYDSNHVTGADSPIIFQVFSRSLAVMLTAPIGKTTTVSAIPTVGINRMIRL